jgi:hypothetical protein
VADRLGPARGMVVGAGLRFASLAVGILLVDGSTSAWMIAGLYSAVSQVFTPAEMAMVRSLRHEASSRAHSIVVALQYGGQGLGRHFDLSTEVTRLGGRVVSTQMRMHNDSGKLIATGAAAYSVG